MTELRFYWAKQLYEEIEEKCLKATLKSKNKDAFNVYEDISKKCYSLLVNLKKMSTVMPLEKIRREDIELRDDRFCDCLEDAIFSAYFSNNMDEKKDDEERAFLGEFDEGFNAYEKLQKFSSKQALLKEVDFNDIVCVFQNVLKILSENISLHELKEKVDVILMPYNNLLYI